MTAEPETKAGGLTALDWAVIVAATVALAVLIHWLIQGRPPKLPGREADAE